MTEPLPFGVTASDFSPSTVSVLIATSDWSPTLTLRSTVNVTFAASPASDDGLDLADLDARDVDVVAGRDAAGVGEVRLVGLALRPERQVAVAERHQHQAAHQHDAEDAGAERVAALGLAIVGTPPLRRVRRSAERNEDVAAGRAVDLHPDRAVVDVEERSVRAERVEPQVVLGERFDDLVDVALALVDVAARVGGRSRGRPAAAVGSSAASRSGRWWPTRAAAMAPAIGSRPSRQTRQQLLQLVDAGVELGALLVDGAEHGVEVVDDVADQLVTRRPGSA